MSFGDVEFSFFKQKTAYEMRISDWSSDVCSSDLPKVGGTDFRVLTYEVKGGPEVAAAGAGAGAGDPAKAAEAKAFARLCLNELVAQAEAGRDRKSAGRERVWQYVAISGAAVALKKNNPKSKRCDERHTEKD